MKNKIGWCDMTFNPVWGCRNKCPYCYARGIAKRFCKQMNELEISCHFERHPTWAWTGDYLSGLKDFKPTFLYSQYCKKLPKKPQRIFIGSMSEIAHWREEWIEMVIEKVKQYPQHTFQFLTKFPEIYSDWVFPENCWLGITIVEGIDSIEWMRFKMSHPDNIKFICLEPLIRPAMAGENSEADLKGIDWVIIGAETGNRKDKVIPKREWIEVVIDFCNKCNRPIYIKDNIVKYYPEYGNIKEFPE